MLRAGILRHKIIIERENITKDSLGDNISTWSKLHEVRASLQPITGSERFINHEQLNDEDTIIRIRYLDITPKDRIIFNGFIYDVSKVLNLMERNRVLTLLATKTFNRVSSSFLLLEDGSKILLEDNSGFMKLEG